MSFVGTFTRKAFSGVALSVSVMAEVAVVVPVVATTTVAAMVTVMIGVTLAAGVAVQRSVQGLVSGPHRVPLLGTHVNSNSSVSNVRGIYQSCDPCQWLPH